MIQVHGDAFLDVWVEVDRRGPSREAPIDIYDQTNQVIQKGGAGNVAGGLTALGIELVDTTTLVEYKTRYTANGEQVFRVDHRAGYNPYIDYEIRPDATHVIVDYDKGTITEALIKRIVASNPRECYVAVRSPKSMYEHLDLRKTTYFCNYDEFLAHSWDHPLGRRMLVTTGPQGATDLMLYTDGNFTRIIEQQPAQARWVKSVCGAGDTVMAAWVACRTNWIKSQALVYAMCAAGVKVENERTYVPTLEEVNARYHEVVGNRDRSRQRCGVLREDNGSEAGIPVQPTPPREEGRDVLRPRRNPVSGIGRARACARARGELQTEAVHFASVPQSDGFSLH